MIKTPNLYEILQVHYNAESVVINAAYKRLCKKYHPDICKEKDASNKIVELNLAYETLKDQRKRSQYDKTLANKEDVKQTKRSVSYECEKKMIDYISCLKNEDYKKAYELISDIDKKNIKLNKFIEWQKEVSRLYAIGNFKVEFFNKNKEYHTKRNRKITVYEFDITIREKQLKDNTIQNFSFSKMIVKENGIWKVLLDFHEIDSLISKFYLKSIQDSTEKNILNLKEFANMVRLESERYNRYQRKFSLVIFDLTNGLKNEKNSKDYISATIDLLLENIRESDFMCLYKKNYVLLLLPETDCEGSKKACVKLCSKLKQNKNSKGILKKHKYAISEYKGENYNQLIINCIAAIK